MSDQERISIAILAKATERGPEKSTCPSEIARQLFPADWRVKMKAVRDAAYELQQQGKVKITQQGRTADPETVKGPIRIQIS